jgi:putative transposase
MFLWQAVDEVGEVLDMLVQKGRSKQAAARLLRKLLKRRGVQPEAIVTDILRAEAHEMWTNAAAAA